MQDDAPTPRSLDDQLEELRHRSAQLTRLSDDLWVTSWHLRTESSRLRVILASGRRRLSQVRSPSFLVLE